MTEKWLITGSHGFIGSNLVDKLQEMGHEVVPGRQDGNDKLFVNYVVNLQAYGNYFYQQAHIGEIYRANVHNLAKLLQEAEHVKGFVHISSTSVDLPVQTPYSASKKAGEELVKVMAGQGIKAISARPASVTGKGEQPQHLIPRLVQSAFTGETIDFDPKPTHDFIDVWDVTNALLVLARRAEQFPGKAINISSGTTIANRDVLDVVESLVGVRIKTKEVSGLRNYDTQHWTVDNSDMLSLGWHPQITLTQSIQGIINEYQRKTNPDK